MTDRPDIVRIHPFHIRNRAWNRHRDAKRRSVAAACALAAATACAPAVAPAPPPASDECVVVDDAARPRITIGVASGGSPAGEPYTAAAIAAAQLYQTLVRVDCTGRVIAGAAAGWSSAGATEWHFRIADDIAFADGTALSAQAAALALSGPRTASPGDARSLIASVAAAGTRDLHVTLTAPARIHLFARPELAIARAAPGRLPVGTGPYTADSATAGRLRLTARSQRDATGANIPDTIDVIAFGRDLRTAVDAGADAVIAADAATIAYARARPEYRLAPLQWDRTYVLTTATPFDSISAHQAGLAFPEAAVGVSLRPAQPPFPWQGCALPVDTSSHNGAAADVVLYLRGDPAARAIAERITALARDRAPDWLRAVLLPARSAPAARGVSAAELDRALRTHSVLAVVTALPRSVRVGCDAVDMMRYEPLAGWHVLPLVDTRMSLIYRPGLGRVTVDGDGSIRFGAQ